MGFFCSEVGAGLQELRHGCGKALPLGVLGWGRGAGNSWSSLRGSLGPSGPGMGSWRGSRWQEKTQPPRLKTPTSPSSWDMACGEQDCQPPAPEPQDLRTSRYGSTLPLKLVIPTQSPGVGLRRNGLLGQVQAGAWQVIRGGSWHPGGGYIGAS